jgi:hypothetical protein
VTHSNPTRIASARSVESSPLASNGSTFSEGLEVSHQSARAQQVITDLLRIDGGLLQCHKRRGTAGGPRRVGRAEAGW